jgi:hypothetical protein
MTAIKQRNTKIALAAAVVIAGATVALWPEAPAPTIEITWQHPDTNVSFLVYSAREPRLEAMTLRTNTAAKAVSFPATKDREFFGVRAVRGTNVSGWGTQ